MNGFLPDPMAWVRMVVDLQKAQMAAAEKLVEAGSGALDAECFEEARQQLEDAGQQAIEAAENWVQAQMQWMSMWRF